MRLEKKIDRVLVLFLILISGFLFACIIKSNSVSTFAEGDSSVVLASESKFVTFYDDGKKLTVRTDASTVGEALERADIIINNGDIVEPGLDSEINMDNYFINIYRARPVLVKDGMIEKYIMTASYDYKSIAKDAGITVYDGDEVKMVQNTHFLENGVATAYEVIRNGGRTLTIEEEIPFSEQTEKDFNMAPGTSEVKQLGELGTKKLTYNIQYVDGEEVSRELVSEEVVKQPVARIVVVGAKPSVRPGTETCAGWAREAGVSEEELAMAIDLIYRESGCRYDATNAGSGAYGIPQALPGSKMASAGSDWQTNPVTQIRWMIGYVNGRYGGWGQALNHWHTYGWY